MECGHPLEAGLGIQVQISGEVKTVLSVFLS